LARFVFIYKLITIFLKYIQNEIKQYHSLIAAFIGGYFIFGEKNNVNEQVIYTKQNHSSLKSFLQL
jgi:peroxisomal membrane protein 4